jgi:CopG antitoxin of type II toxin-antitoxin system
MTKRDRRELIPLTSYDQEPEGMTEAEAREFWDTHAITEEYLASMPPVSDDDFPPIGPPRKWVGIHLKREGFEKVRKLARRRGIRVDDLIDDLATQALAAEEDEGRVRATGS